MVLLTTEAFNGVKTSTWTRTSAMLLCTFLVWGVQCLVQRHSPGLNCWPCNKWMTCFISWATVRRCVICGRLVNLWGRVVSLCGCVVSLCGSFLYLCSFLVDILFRNMITSNRGSCLERDRRPQGQRPVQMSFHDSEVSSTHWCSQIITLLWRKIQ